MEEFKLQLKDMPEYLLQRITGVLHAYSTALIRLHIDENGKEQHLHIGAGTFVSIGDIDGLLTATHVVEKLESRSVLGLLMAREGEIHSYKVPMSSLSITSIGARISDQNGPDLSLIVFANSENVSTIKASKSFFPLLNEDTVVPETNQGIWFTCGTPEEYVTEENNPSGKGRVLTLHNICGGGGPDREYMINDLDYYEFPIDVQTGVPKNFSGMSGGAVWQVTIKKNADGTLAPVKYYFSGVIYYENYREDGIRILRSHGRKTIKKLCTIFQQSK
jgi:hypothetical protein